MDIYITAVLDGLDLYLFGGLKVLREYERAVYFFLGRSWGAKGPGLIYVPPLFAKTQTVSLRVVAMDIPPQDVITRDNISIKVNAVLYMLVRDPVKAVIGVENYLYATSQLAQTTLRSVLGETELDELLMSREKINNTEGELQASEKLAQAARIIGSEPAAIQLRYLQTVTEISSENNSTTFFPIPIDLLKGFFDLVTKRATPPALPERTAGESVSAAPAKTKVQA